MPTTTIESVLTGPWPRTPRSIAPPSFLARSHRDRFLAASTINTVESNIRYTQVTREEFARHIAEYFGKYIRSEQVLRERVRDDAARLDQLWKVRQNQSELALMPETDTEL